MKTQTGRKGTIAAVVASSVILGQLLVPTQAWARWDDRSDELKDDGSSTTTYLLAGAAVALVVAGVIVLMGGDDDKETTSEPSSGRQEPADDQTSAAPAAPETERLPVLSMTGSRAAWTAPIAPFCQVGAEGMRAGIALEL